MEEELSGVDSGICPATSYDGDRRFEDLAQGVFYTGLHGGDMGLSLPPMKI